MLDKSDDDKEKSSEVEPEAQGKPVSEEADKAGDPDTAKKLRDEAGTLAEESSDVGPGAVLLLLGAAALGLYVVSERQRQAEQAAAARAGAAAMAAARQQNLDNHHGTV